MRGFDAAVADETHPRRRRSWPCAAYIIYMQHCASERRHQHHNRPARHRGGGLEEDKADGAASGAPIGAIAGGSIAATLTAALYIWLRIQEDDKHSNR